jgi:plasmid stabilization system protein ParE
MSRRVAITPDAAADILNARAWYDSQETGAGDKFYFAFQKRINKALDMPLSPRAWGRRKIRKVRIPKYPYSAYYEIVGEELRVLAVVHGARDPKYLNYRLR